MIYTGYYHKIKFYMDNGLTPIAISGKTPDWYQGIHWKHLAPSYSIWRQWDKHKNEEVYTKRFFSEILSKLNPRQIYNELQMYNEPILLCYEAQGFCHRHLIADWFNSYNIDCKEFK